MRRYTRIPRADWYKNDERTFVPDLTVYERDRSPEWSGLYDEGGEKLYAYEEYEPVGFIRLRER